jgi:flavin-dependent dehydrogenase
VTREAYAINALRLVTPGMHDLVVSSPEDVAIVCNRRTLDHLLLKRAQQTGARFLPNFDVQYLLQRDDRVVGFRSADGREVHADYTVVADGAHSRFGPDRGPRRLIQAIMGWWDDVPFRPHQVEMIFDKAVAPYYGWLFPEGPNRVNIGICYDDPKVARNARQLFRAFLDQHYGAPPAKGPRGRQLEGASDLLCHLPRQAHFAGQNRPSNVRRSPAPADRRPLDARKAQRFTREDHMSNAVKTVSDPEFTKAFLIRKQGEQPTRLRV